MLAGAEVDDELVGPRIAGDQRPGDPGQGGRADVHGNGFEPGGLKQIKMGDDPLPRANRRPPPNARLLSGGRRIGSTSTTASSGRS